MRSHVAVWPGKERNTCDITRFIAIESRSFVISASSLMSLSDVPGDFSAREDMATASRAVFANGGSAIAGPDGRSLVPPQTDREVLINADLDHAQVCRERQNFDLAGHYSRPDVTRLYVARLRQSTIELNT